ncbi:uncharacterized protein LOC142764956 [Rhipicephalus microplus]|uniref:uncharacterized protein LOC142764956 n=1 Tax=Rhipicephalus microplus TaxID=6941 RepID=UPI0023767789
MAKNIFMSATQLLAIMIILSISGLALNSWSKDPDISFFYSNHSVIYTLRTTMNADRACKVDYVNQTTTDHTEFRRVYVQESNSPYEDIWGIFINMDRTKDSPPYNGMVLSIQPGGMNKTIEELLHVFGNSLCGVFAIYPITVVGVFYELRVKTPVIASVSEECVKEFLKVAGTPNNTRTCALKIQQ